MKTDNFRAIISSDWNQCLAPCGPFDPMVYTYPDLTSDLTTIFKEYTNNGISLGTAKQKIKNRLPGPISIRQMDAYLDNSFITYKGVPELIDWCAKNKILFINASNEYEKHPEVRRLNRLSEEHIKKIVEVYREFKEVEGFSRIVSIEEVKEKDYNLNVSLYVYPEVEGEKIDLAKEFEEFKEIEEKERSVLGEALGYVAEILKVSG